MFERIEGQFYKNMSSWCCGWPEMACLLLHFLRGGESVTSAYLGVCVFCFCFSKACVQFSLSMRR